jgi:hypothetical protein
VSCRIGALVWHQNASDIAPHARREQKRQNHARFGVPQQAFDVPLPLGARAAPCYNLFGPSSRATRCSDFPGNRRSDRHLLLVRARALSPERGRLQRGRRSGAGLTRPKYPYDRPIQLYPLTCTRFGLPFVWMRPEVAGGGVLRSEFGAHGIRTIAPRISPFAGIHGASPFGQASSKPQWAPLIIASAFFPLLLPATLAKPQLGIPVAFTSLTKRGLLACLVVVALTWLVVPRWPWF